MLTDTTHQVIVVADVDAWAREHWLTVHPWAERVRVVRVVRSPPIDDW